MAAKRDPEVRRQDRPPERQGPKIRIRRLKGSEHFDGCIVSEGITGLFIHYDERSRRSEPCLEKDFQCPGCERKLPSKWRGYLHVYPGGLEAPYILELTAEAAEMLLTLAGDRPTLRGLRVVVRRSRADNGRLSVHLHPVQVDKFEALPNPVDPVPVLHFLWSFKRGSDGPTN
jgi:hypothetical protein